MNDREKTRVIKQGVHYDVETMTAGFGMTINLGDFESARIDRAITIRNKAPELPMDDIKLMLKSVGDICKKQVIKEVKKVYKMDVIEE